MDSASSTPTTSPPETAAQTPAATPLETMNIVIVGHVDHGKSTLVGRLLADTKTLPEGKIEQVQASCRRQGKVFEYAFLLDALEAEQDQGITIDAARVFFKTALRDYIIIDAPGHVEFLKNMVTGAARAEAAILLIDAGEGVQENSRRHGYLLAMLGIRQVIVAINKMDLVAYDQQTFNAIAAEYRDFLAGVGVTPLHMIPVAARNGATIAQRLPELAWYQGPTILEAVDGLGKEPSPAGRPLRLPVQDVYKWGHRGDDRRIIAGRVEAGSLAVGDVVVFSPSGKQAEVASIEAFSAPPAEQVTTGRSTGITLREQIFAERGDVISHRADPPAVADRLRVKLFWLGRAPMTGERPYKLKLATAEVEARVAEIHRILDASALDTRTDKVQIDRHDVADLTLALRRPIAVDRVDTAEITGRFVIVDGYDIAGGGIISDHELASATKRPEDRRRQLLGHAAALLTIVGPNPGAQGLARALEAALIDLGLLAYVVGLPSSTSTSDARAILRAQVAALLDAGLVVIIATDADPTADDLKDQPHPTVTIAVGGGDNGGENGGENGGANGGDKGEDEAIRVDPELAPSEAAAAVVADLRTRGLLR